MQFSSRRLSLCGVLAAATVISCTGVSGNESGRVEARGIGAAPATPLERVPFDEELVSACSEGAMLVPGVIDRMPYVQQVTPSGATFVWTATTDAPMGLEVTLPDGTLVTVASASLDETATRYGNLQHVSVVDGLEPGTVYCYQVTNAEGAVAERIGFRTAPTADAGAPVTFVALGDMGSGHDDQLAVLGQMLEVPFDLMLTVGDNAYDDGTMGEFERNFFDVYESVLRSVPVYPAAGNHDYRTDDLAPYLEVFVLPENAGPEARERWYSFDRGDVHFVVLDTERLGAAQLDWLEADLAASDAPWTVVTMHEPPFSSGEHGSSTDVREQICPLLERHGVDLVLAGHDHNYERTHAIDGPVYVVTGGGGRGTRPVGASSFTAYAEDVLHFVWVRVEGDTLDLRAIDATGQEFDSLVLRP